MSEKDKTIIEVSRELGLSILTLRRYEKEGLISIRKKYSARYREKIRAYTDEDIRLIKWIKRMSGGNRSNFEYIRLLLDYIRTGRISAAKLGWPLK